MSSLPPRVHLLDVREVAEPALAGSVWIPFSELPRRMSELPAPGAEIWVANGLASPEALEFLAKSGREVRFVEPVFGEREPARLWSPHPWLEGFKGPGGVALDLGCGNGRETAFLVAAGYRVIAIDRLPEAIAAASAMVERYAPANSYPPALAPRSAARFSGLVGDHDTFAPTEPLDLIVCLMAMPLRLAHLAETHLRPGGYLLGECYARAHQKTTGSPRDARRTFEAQLCETSLTSVQKHEDEGRIRYLFQRL
jgi:SAM-dependent methyltransferase